MAEACIVSIGSVNLDLQVRSDRWPEPGETLPASDFLAVGGGKAANVAILARRMGVPAILAARLGQDPFARLALEPLRAAGVELRHTRRDARRARSRDAGGAGSLARGAHGR